MATKCVIENCISASMYFCECQQPKLAFCLKHIQEHNLLPGNHKSIESSLKIPNRKKLAQHFLAGIQHFIKVKEEILEETNKQISALLAKSAKVFNVIKEYESEAQEIVEFLYCSKFIVNNENRSSNENMILRFMMNPLSILDHYRERAHKIVNSYRRGGKLYKKKLNKKDNLITLIKPGTKELIEVNSDGLISKFNLVIDQNITEYPSFCCYENNKIFCIGDQQAFGFIIDKNNLNGRKFTIDVGRHAVGQCCYYKDAVYRFGYWNGVDSIKVNINSLQYVSIAKIPNSAGFVSCARFREKIAIIGCNGGNLSIYDTELDNYNSIGLGVTEENKIMIKANGRFYIFVGTKVIESEEQNPLKFKIINQSSVISWHYPRPYKMRASNYYYFIIYPWKLYRFDLEKKDLSLVKELSF